VDREWGGPRDDGGGENEGAVESEGGWREMREGRGGEMSSGRFILGEMIEGRGRRVCLRVSRWVVWSRGVGQGGGRRWGMERDGQLRR